MPSLPRACLLAALVTVVLVTTCDGQFHHNRDDKSCRRCLKTNKPIVKIINKSSGWLETGKQSLKMHCLKYSWSIVGANRENKIRLKFTNFLLADGDRVKIFDGLKKSDDLVAEFTKGHKPQMIVTSASRILVTLTTTSEITERQFSAFYDETSCGGLIKLNEQTAVTLSLPGKKEATYSPNSDCLWVVVPKQFRKSALADISLKTILFETEKDQDVLQIYNSLDKNDQKVLSLSGKVPPRLLKSFKGTPGLLFRFRSTARKQRTGFKFLLTLSNYNLCENEDIDNGGVYVSNFSQRADYWCCAGYKLTGPAHKACRGGWWFPRNSTLCKSENETTSEAPSPAVVNYSECGISNPLTCAQQHQKRTKRIVGGCAAKDGDWPWVVGIYAITGKELSFRCGGSIINEHTILTSATCIAHGEEAGKYLVVAGDRMRFVNESTESTYTVCAVSLHEKFSTRTSPIFDGDIALLHLCCCIEYGPHARPVCLPNKAAANVSKTGTIGTVVGWGVTKKEAFSASELRFTVDQRQVELPITDSEVCKAVDPLQVTDSMFCAGDGRGGKDACNGDSGGPFLIKEQFENKERFVVEGIVSWGTGCAQENSYGVYTKVAKYLVWIQSATDRYANTIECTSATCSPKVKIV